MDTSISILMADVNGLGIRIAAKRASGLEAV
jgi:hypothetical protein